MKTRHILGMNARNRLYLRLNKTKGRKIADSKLRTKKILKKAGLPTPELLAIFKTTDEVFEFNWLSLPDNFVLKPVSGYGGEGIVVIKKKAKFAGEWFLMDDSVIGVADLRRKTLDILAGQYSLHNWPDWAMVEERIKIAKIFKKYAFQGTPDVRIIVYNRVPVMAMLRLPTAASKGKANLHQGAIGVGIDIATGITTHGVCQGKFLKYVPGTKKKINGLKLPFWNTILSLAVRAQEVVPSLGYLGVDIVYDKAHGPMILELNARPGMEIQNANLTPLRKRLERVEGLEIRDAEHGVKIAKALFAERFLDRVKAEEGIKTIKAVEEIRILDSQGKKIVALAKIDTGAWGSSIDMELARELGIYKKGQALWFKKAISVLGEEKRPVITITFWLAGRRIKTTATVAKRTSLTYKVIVGRQDLGGFLVDATII